MFEVVAIYDLLEERRINDVTVNFFIFFIIYGIVSDILALRFCATLLFFLHFDVTCDPPSKRCETPLGKEGSRIIL